MKDSGRFRLATCHKQKKSMTTRPGFGGGQAGLLHKREATTKDILKNPNLDG